MVETTIATNASDKETPFCAKNLLGLFFEERKFFIKKKNGGVGLKLKKKKNRMFRFGGEGEKKI